MTWFAVLLHPAVKDSEKVLMLLTSYVTADTGGFIVPLGESEVADDIECENRLDGTAGERGRKKKRSVFYFNDQ